MSPKKILNVDLFLQVYRMLLWILENNKNALSSVESRLLGDEFCCQRPRCRYTTFSFGIQNECCMS